MFFHSSERQKGLDTLMNLLNNASKEVYIFDPYIYNNLVYNKLDSIEALLIIAKNYGVKKHLIFKCSDENWLKEIEIAFKRNFQTKNIYYDIKNDFCFYNAKKDFHDRYIFNIGENYIEGFHLGTSLEGIGKNYTLINPLGKKLSEEIFTVLKKDLM